MSFVMVCWRITRQIQKKSSTSIQMDPNAGIECGCDGYTPTTSNILNHKPGSGEVLLEKKSVIFCSFTPASCRLESDQKNPSLAERSISLGCIGPPTDHNIGITTFAICRLNPIISYSILPPPKEKSWCSHDPLSRCWLHPVSVYIPSYPMENGRYLKYWPIQGWPRHSKIVVIWLVYIPLYPQILTSNTEPRKPWAKRPIMVCVGLLPCFRWQHWKPQGLAIAAPSAVKGHVARALVDVALTVHSEVVGLTLRWR